MSLETMVMAVVATTMGGFVQGCTGFGFNLIAMPLMMLVVDPKEVVPLLIVFSFMTDVLVAYESRKDADARLYVPLIAGGWFGSYLGVTLLQNMSSPALKTVAGIALVLIAAVLMSGRRRPVNARPPVVAGVGVVSGVFGGSMSISGPPVIVFLANQGIEKTVFRASASRYFAILNLFSLVLLSYRGLLTFDVVRPVAIAFPLVMFTSWLGIRTARRLNTKLFSRIALLLVCVMGVVLALAGARALLASAAG